MRENAQRLNDDRVECKLTSTQKATSKAKSSVKLVYITEL